MAVVRFALGAAAMAALAMPASAAAEGMCHVIDLDMQPADIANGAPMSAASQIVAWIEDTQGNYVDTIFITQQTGSFGLGNRPGRFDFNGGPRWPYGRRINVFPIWAHRRAASGAPTWEEIVFQNDGGGGLGCVGGAPNGVCDPSEDNTSSATGCRSDCNQNDSNLSHPFNESSKEMHFCRPLISSEPAWDTGTCASVVFTDKGVFHPSRTSLYPPRNDLVRATPDHSSVDQFAMLNPFDAVSMATPPSGMPFQLSWSIPDGLANGNYVVWMEVSREFDHNATYSTGARPSPLCHFEPLAGGLCCNKTPVAGVCPCKNPPLPNGMCDAEGPDFGPPISWREYGHPNRGQPSVVYKVPFALGSGDVVATALDYEGYSDPDGTDGDLRAPDGTISTGVSGSGAERLSILVDGSATYRVRVKTKTENDFIKPAAPTSADVNTLTSNSAIIEFTAPGDDGLVGKAKAYEIRYVSGSNLTEENFAEGIELKPDIVVATAGTVQEFPFTGLLFDTEYTVGIRAVDDCRNTGPVAFVSFRTPDRASGEVDACFVATAAYGSVMANDVEMLRRFRDMFLQSTVLGELVVEAYYTFGPAVAGVVGESELLRATARAVLDPIIGLVKVVRF